MSKLIDQVRAQRQQWLDVAPGKRLQIIRPAESQFGEIIRRVKGKAEISIELPHVCKFVTGWEGFTEADFLGETVGASDPLPFDPELWAEVVADRGDLIKLVSAALIESVVKHFEKKAEAEKN